MPKWSQRKGDNGPIFLMDSEERVVGVRDKRGVDWHIPMVQSSPAETEGIEAPIAGAGGHIGEVPDEAAMLLISGTAGQTVKRTDTGTDWRLDSNTDPEDDSAERLARWRNLGVAAVSTLPASAITVADVGGKWVGADSETIFSEAADRLEALESPPLAELWDYLLQNVVSKNSAASGFTFPRGHGDTTTAGFGISTTVYGVTSAAAAGSYANTNEVTRSPRNLYASSVATADNLAGLRFSTLGYVSDAAGFGGIFARVSFAAADAAPVANAMCYAGTRATGSDTVGTQTVLTLVNCIGFGADRGESVMSLWHNDAAGNATKITLTDGPNGVGGAALNWPAHDTTERYTVTIYNPPGTLNWTATLKRHSTGQTYTKTLIYGTDTTDLPAADTVQVLHLFRGSGSTALATQLAWFHTARGLLDVPAIAAIAGGAGGSIDLANADPWTKAQDVTAVNLGSLSGAVVIDTSLSNTFYGTLSGNVTSITLTNGRSGRHISLQLKQAAGASYTVAYGSLKPMNGVTGLMSATNNAVDLVHFSYYNADAAFRYMHTQGVA